MTGCALLLVAAFIAQDQDTSLMKLGPVGIQPALLLQNVGRDPNVFNSETDPQSDFTMTITPKVDVTLRIRRVKTTFNQKVDYVYFKKFASERGVNQSYTVRGDFDLGIFQPFASASTASSKNRINNEVDERARYHTNEYFVGTDVHVFTRTTLSVKARQTDTTFDSNEFFRGESLAAAFNGELRGLDTSVGVAVTPLTSLKVVFTNEQQRFDLEPKRNSDSFRVMPTLVFSPLGLLNGTAGFGYRRFTPTDPAVPPFDGFVAEVSAGITVKDRHRLSTTYTRDVSYSYDSVAVYYVTNSVGGTWAFTMGRGFDIQLGASRNRMHYHQTASTGPADDTYTSYEPSFGYRIRPRLRASLNGIFAQRRSQVSADRAFDSNRVYGTVTWGQ